MWATRCPAEPPPPPRLYPKVESLSIVYTLPPSCTPPPPPPHPNQVGNSVHPTRPPDPFPPNPFPRAPARPPSSIPKGQRCP